MLKFSGNIVAIVTPMLKSCKSIDYASFKNLITWHIAAKTDAIVVAGSTGEAPTLTTEEWIQLVETAVKTADNKIPIIAGTGTNCTKTTIEKTILSSRIGANAALIVTPYYNKPTQLGLQLHFAAIASKTDLPIILYNVPSRTGCDLLPETVAALAKITNIIGIKEATGKLERVKILKKYCGKDFTLLSGDDLSFLEFMELGGDGVVSVTANIFPEEMSKICQLMLQHKLHPNSKLIASAKQINQALTKLHTELMIQTNPIPVKWLLSYLGKIEEAYRLPLTPLETHYKPRVLAAYQDQKQIILK